MFIVLNALPLHGDHKSTPENPYTKDRQIKNRKKLANEKFFRLIHPVTVTTILVVYP
jgi:hypothetical protein